MRVAPTPTLTLSLPQDLALAQGTPIAHHAEAGEHDTEECPGGRGGGRGRVRVSVRARVRVSVRFRVRVRVRLNC